MKKKIVLTVLALVLLVASGYLISQNIGSGINPIPTSTPELMPEQTPKPISELIPMLETDQTLGTIQLSPKGDVSGYENIHDDRYPIPTLNGDIIPYENFSLPQNVCSYSLTFRFTDMSLIEVYKEQLKSAGFVENKDISALESLWVYNGEKEGEKLLVEIQIGENEEGKELFTISMC
jgi:hypothetical protein